MIDKEILDAVLPLPTLDELKEQKVEELKDEGFVISNFHSGGVFYTMLMIVLRINVEVIELLRVVLNNMFVSHAGGAWLDLKMADYSKKRKKAQKTQGFITVRRADMTGEAVKIPKGHVFKSILDINGEELRFFVLEGGDAAKGASSVDVLVEAETEGSRYKRPRRADRAHADLPRRRHIQQRRGLDRAGRQRHRGRREREGANTPLVVGAGAAGDGGHLR